MYCRPEDTRILVCCSWTLLRAPAVACLSARQPWRPAQCMLGCLDATHLVALAGLAAETWPCRRIQHKILAHAAAAPLFFLLLIPRRPLCHWMPLDAARFLYLASLTASSNPPSDQRLDFSSFCLLLLPAVTISDLTCPFLPSFLVILSVFGNNKQQTTSLSASAAHFRFDAHTTLMPR